MDSDFIVMKKDEIRFLKYTNLFVWENETLKHS